MKTLWTALTEPNRVHIVELLRDGPLKVAIDIGILQGMSKTWEYLTEYVQELRGFLP